MQQGTAGVFGFGSGQKTAFGVVNQQQQQQQQQQIPVGTSQLNFVPFKVDIFIFPNFSSVVLWLNTGTFIYFFLKVPNDMKHDSKSNPGKYFANLNLQSIAALPPYDCKSPDEYRWEDYQIHLQGGKRGRERERGLTNYIPPFNFYDDADYDVCMMLSIYV